jgi:GT2 family glycosyltransferase
MDLSILIVTYNSARLVVPLLSRLQIQLQELNAQVIVVDNASKDSTVEVIRAEHPWVQLVASPDNLGFAAGNNLAAKHATGENLLLLNPDAIPYEGALKRGLALLASHQRVGLAGGELRGPDNSRQPTARMFPRLRDELFVLTGMAARFPKSPIWSRLDRGWADPEQAAQVDWIPGAFVFIPTKVFRQMGGFDERFFMYHEEVDLCRRMAKAGYTVRYWPEIKAMHIGGESAKTVDQARISRSGSPLESWRMRSALLYYRKHHGRWGATGLLCIEWTWIKLRQIKAVLQGKTTKAQDFDQHANQFAQAWRDTAGGQNSPQKPW